MVRFKAWSKFELGIDEFNSWYQEKYSQMIAVIESDEIVNFTGKIDELKEGLNPYLLNAKAQYLLNKPYAKGLWIEDKLAQSMESDDSSAFILFGSPGIGKSAFSAHIMDYNHNIVSTNFCELDKRHSLEQNQ